MLNIDKIEYLRFVTHGGNHIQNIHTADGFSNELETEIMDALTENGHLGS